MVEEGYYDYVNDRLLQCKESNTGESSTTFQTFPRQRTTEINFLFKVYGHL